MSPKKSRRQPPFPLFTHFPSPLERTAYRFYNTLDNNLYPVRPLFFGASAAALAAYFAKHEESRLLSLLPKVGQGLAAKWSRIAVASLLTAYTPALALRTFLRLFYFKYKRYVFENPKQPSLLTRLWGAVAGLLSLVPPRLKSCDAMLPAPPLPALEQTVQRYLDAVQPLYSEEELEAFRVLADNFLKEEGPQLQRYAWFSWLIADNYVTNFWEKGAYMCNRECLLISSSVAHGDTFEVIPATQAVRAAHIIYIETLSQLAIDRQTYKPPGNGLVCTRHYEKLYAVTRVPGHPFDRIDNYGISKHAAVIYNGGIYKVCNVDKHGRLLTVDELTDIFNELLSRPGTKTEGAKGRIATLTHDRRQSWAANRKRFFEDVPKNRKALEIIESAAFVLNLTEDEGWGYDPANPDRLSAYMKTMLAGDGVHRWVDKSINYMVAKDGRYGGMGEHSMVDGSELDHIFEHFHLMDTQILEYPSLEEQVARARNLDVASLSKRLPLAERLHIEVTPEMESEIERIYPVYRAALDDVDLDSMVFRDWGKGRIKQCGVSPDAFMQMAIQLAYYKDQGRFVHTYEAASARFYRNSRTETLRSVSDESCAFVNAMLDPSSDRATRVSLLKKATVTHTAHNRECSVNKGVDRHLFVLYVLSRGTDISSPFLNEYIKQEWLLSTSHIPNVTGTMDEDGEPHTSWLGACFGAVAKNGYGICYRFAGNHSICAHISSFHSAENTDARQFRLRIEESLREMSALFQ